MKNIIGVVVVLLVVGVLAYLGNQKLENSKNDNLDLRQSQSKIFQEIESLKNQPKKENDLQVINQVKQEVNDSLKKSEDFVLNKLITVESGTQSNQKEILELKNKVAGYHEGEKVVEKVEPVVPVVPAVIESVVEVAPVAPVVVPNKEIKKVKKDYQITCYSRLDVLHCMKDLKDSIERRCYSKKTTTAFSEKEEVSEYLKLKEDFISVVKVSSVRVRNDEYLCSTYTIDTHCSAKLCN